MIVKATPAARAYVLEQIKEYPFPSSPKQFQLLMEIAFIEGAQWYNEQQVIEAQAKLDALQKEATNARS